MRGREGRKQLKVQQKFDAVVDVLRGTPAKAVAARLGVDASDVADWERRFVRAGRRALGFDFDGDVEPTIDDLLAAAQRGFPSQVLRGARSCAGLFAARFYGKNDIIHVFRAGVPEVEVVDIDQPRLEVMRRIYPANWTYKAANVFELVKEYRASGRVFDVVICDCYENMAVAVLTELYEQFRSITGRHLLVYANKPMLDRLQIAATPGGLSRALSARNGVAVKVTDQPVRSSAHGGTYWVVIDVAAPG